MRLPSRENLSIRLLVLVPLVLGAWFALCALHKRYDPLFELERTGPQQARSPGPGLTGKTPITVRPFAKNISVPIRRKTLS